MFIIAGLYRRQRLVSPKGMSTRPTASRLREAVFNICQQEIEGARFLDLFAGSGAMGFEALSRGAQSVTFVEANKETIQCIRENAAHLKVESQCRIFKGEVFATLEWLERQGESFDLIYADPPYHTLSSSFSYSTQVIQWMDEHALLKTGGFLFMEEDFRYPPSLDGLRHLELKSSRRMGQALLQQYQKPVLA